MKPTWLRRGDVGAALAVGGAALLAAVFLWTGQASATQVEVHLPDGAVTVYSLAQTRTVDIVGKQEIALQLEIDNGRARVRESRCPDQVCVHSGWLSRSGQTAACVPSGVYIQIVGGNYAVDGVTA